MPNVPAPAQLNLTIESGADYVLAVSLVDVNTGAAINVTNPVMQIKLGSVSTGPAVIAPTLGVVGNTVTATVTGQSTKYVPQEQGSYDLFATRVDTSAVVKLAKGTVTLDAAVTILP